MITREEIIINKVTPNLPIIVFPGKEVLVKLREILDDESIDLQTELEIHSIYDGKEEGGLTCEIRKRGLNEEESDSIFLCSITQLKIKRGEPNYEVLEKYRIKRIRNLKRQNRNRIF